MQIKKETNHARGFQAEEAAADYLKKQGFEILQRRYKTKFGEIDLIIRKKTLICFVEVKIRQTETEAMEAVNLRAQKRIENTALIFLSENPQYVAFDTRFDVVAIVKPFQILHLDNAWEARS